MLFCAYCNFAPVGVQHIAISVYLSIRSQMSHLHKMFGMR